MRKIFLLLFVAGVLTACNNKAGSNATNDTSTKSVLNKTDTSVETSATGPSGQAPTSESAGHTDSSKK